MPKNIFIFLLTALFIFGDNSVAQEAKMAGLWLNGGVELRTIYQIKDLLVVARLAWKY